MPSNGCLQRPRLNTGARASRLHTALPAAPLRACISHYWLCLNNADTHHAILPDGAVDIVWSLGAAAERHHRAAPHTCHSSGPCLPWSRQTAQVFGSSRTRTLWPLLRGSHYLGIRFWPGQARHFLNVPASALTGQTLAADEALLPSLRGLCQMGGPMDELLTATIIASTATRPNATLASATAEVPPAPADGGIAALWARLDAWLLAHLYRCPLRITRMDAVIRHMQATPTAEQNWRVAPLAALCGKSRRQFERQFLDAVGLSPKRFAEALRFQRALALMTQANCPLAQIAAELGYADQSHFSRAFARLYGQPPARARRDAAFVQDVQHFSAQNDSLLSH